MNARDLIQLKRSYNKFLLFNRIVEQLESVEANNLTRMILILVKKLTDLLEEAIVENPPISIKEGNIIQDGYQ